MSIPYFTNRNARYRGPRESEKHLQHHAEKQLDFSIITNANEELSESCDSARSDLITTGGNVNRQYVICTKTTKIIYDIKSLEWMHQKAAEQEAKIQSFIKSISNE